MMKLSPLDLVDHLAREAIDLADRLAREAIDAGDIGGELTCAQVNALRREVAIVIREHVLGSQHEIPG